MELENGAVYRTRGGAVVGPMDGTSIGHDLIFSAVMVSGRRFFWTSDGEPCANNAGLEIVAKLEARTFGLSFTTAIGTINASVSVYGKSLVIVHTASLDRVAMRLPLSEADLSTLGIRAETGWNSLRQAITTHARIESAA